MRARKVTHLPLAIPGIADATKAFICAAIDMDIHDPICLAVIAERNLRLLKEDSIA